MTKYSFNGYTTYQKISTHTPLAGCDILSLRFEFYVLSNFNSHTPYRVWLRKPGLAKALEQFQFPHSLRSVTFPKLQYHVDNHFHFNSHTPYEVWLRTISAVDVFLRFQPTHPLRGVTHHNHQILDSFRDFNSNTPYEVWHINFNPSPNSRVFQFTHPLQGVTMNSRLVIHAIRISIHALLMECDLLCYDLYPAI